MSVEAITWALKAQLPSSTAKFVLVVLCNCASADRWIAYPSIPYLSQATGQNRKTVQDNLRRLKEWGLIEDTGKRTGDTGRVVVYRILRQENSTEIGPISESTNGPEIGPASTNPNSGALASEIGPNSSGNRPVFPPKQAQKRAAEPLELKATKERGGAVAQLVLPDWLQPELWADWHKFRNARPGWTPKARELSLAKLCALREQGGDPRQIIEQSIERGWTGLFPIRAPEPARAGSSSAVGGGHNPGGVSPRLGPEEAKEREREALAAMRAQLGSLGVPL